MGRRRIEMFQYRHVLARLRQGGLGARRRSLPLGARAPPSQARLL